MAAKTPNRVRVENIGSLKLLIALFSPEQIDSGDTWASGVKHIAGAWFSSKDASVFDAAMGIDWTVNGLITFTTADSSQEGTVFILCKG